MSQTELDRLFDRSLMLGAMYFAGMAYFGVPIWKAVIVSLGIVLVVFAGWATRWFIRGALALLAFMTLVWIEAIPHPKAWKSEAYALAGLMRTSSIDTNRSVCERQSASLAER